MKNYSVVINEQINKELLQHLLRSDKQEDLCFATYSPVKGSKRFTGIINSVILPKEGERLVHGNAEFFPDYLIRALKIASEKNEGLVFIHSHPFPGWQSMSIPDIVAEKRIAPSAFGMTKLSLLGLTVSSDEVWSGRFWIKDEIEKRIYIRSWCENIRIIGDKLTIHFNDNILIPSLNSDKQIRTISSWGKKTQSDISRIRVCIVGLGSVGSNISEILARTGFSNFTLIDFDSVEEKNLDRTLGIFPDDIGQAKIAVVANAIKKSATSRNINIECVEYSICEEEGFKAALNCDIIFSCVDRPWPRQVLNSIAYAYLIPVIDGGIKVRTNPQNTKLMGAYWRAHIVGYGKTCLECLNQYTTSLAKVERDGKLDDPTYIEGLMDKTIINANENVFVFSTTLASMLVLQLLSFFIAPGGNSNISPQIYQMTLGKIESDNRKCHHNCIFQTIIGKGDLINFKLYDEHKLATQRRENRFNYFNKNK